VVSPGGGRRGRGRAKQPSGKGANPRAFVALIVVLLLVGGGVLAYLARHPRETVATLVDPNLPPAQATGHSMGRPDAPVQVLEFADFECPACANYSVVTEPDVRKRIIEPGLARVTYYDFPLPQHKNTWVASEAAACAGDQGKFWEMHDRLFQGQNDWNTEATSDPASVMKGYAKDLGLAVDTWQTCLLQHTHRREIEASKAEAQRRHVDQTPTFVIGNRMIPGSLTDDQMKAYVDSARGAAGTASTTAGR
jgi:protein-disulfide isomerase